jgi:hypothetical protein
VPPAAAAGGGGGGHEPPLKQPRLAKQSSTNAAAASTALAEARGAGQAVLDELEAAGPFAKQQLRQVAVKQEPGAAAGPAAGGGRSGGSRAVLEVYVEPPGGGEWAVARLQRSKLTSFVDMWRQLQGELPALLTGQQVGRLKVVYLDAAGDWVMALPDQRWQAFAAAARRVLVTSRC